MNAGLQLVLPVNDDLLVCAESGVDQRLTIADLRDLDLANRDRVVRTDDIRVRPVWSLLDDGGWNRQTVVARVEKQSCIDELSGPQPVFLVRTIGLELD